ncbi:superoxide dismutase [Candidatus Phytoplasma oryzae]|uniref:Superoxide dismutase n=1 Tax=Candidatus Phytoplasma oryzae TaxID=203274 RepID=A0A139JQ66_9MOLU|nr:superoxide dismutase [Candidatus Phytoplasma oryzae]KXT29117.1 superoxide dismutase [Candidatus Phytoplasma oryzae]
MKIYNLPKLKYNFEDLEPFIDEKTMKLHYLKHHKNYLVNLNLSLSKYPNIKEDLNFLLKNPNLIPDDIRLSVQNNGGGHINHSFFWKILQKQNNNEKQISAKLKDFINIFFGNLENFKNEFSDKAVKIFGSGWLWLILDFEKKLRIIPTANQNTTLNIGYPLIGLDVWEHAYYLSYQNRRLDYIEAFYNIINWNQVSKNLEESLLN